MSQVNCMSEGARRILRIAAPLFAEKGYNGVSTNDIAAAAGGSKANVFHHFPNKQALYLAVIRSACHEVGAELSKLSDDGAEGQRLRSLAREHLVQLFANPDSVRLILREVFGGESGIERSLVAEIVHQNFGLIVDAIREEQDHGRVRDDVDPVMVAVTIIALNLFYFQTWTILEELEEFAHLHSPQLFAEEAFNSVVKGLQAR